MFHEFSSISDSSLLVSDAPARLAGTCSISFGTDVGWVSDVVQPVITDQCRSAFVRSSSAKDIGRSGDWFKMIGVNTTPNTTEMIQVESAWRTSPKMGIKDSVSELSSVYLDRSAAVPVRQEFSLPDPAPVYINDVSNEIVDICGFVCGASGEIAPVVALTQTTSQSAYNAFMVIDGTHIHEGSLTCPS